MGDEWIFDDHYFKIPIDNDMDMISEFSNLILNYYLSNNINIGYKEFDTSALNLMRLESNFLKIDELDQFILNLIQNVEAETITAEDLNFSVATVLSNDKKIEYITPKLSNDLYKLSLKDARNQFEKYYFEFHIKSKLSITELSKKSGVERTHLYRKLKKLNISTK